MPRVPADYVPSYRLHKQSGQGVVTLSAKDYLLGPFHAPESRVKYHQLVAEWLASGRKPLGVTPVTASPFRPTVMTVASLVAAHDRYARSYYLTPDGEVTTEVRNFAHATAPLLDLFATIPADMFTPSCLKAVRDRMVSKRWARTLINKHVNRIRSLWKWAASEEIVKADVYQALTTLAPLKRGRSSAKESKPVGTVPLADVEAIRPHVAAPVWALIQLQRFTGARGGELFNLRALDINTTGPVWTFKPTAHKTAHFGHTRTIYFGPRAQEVLGPFLSGRPVDAYLFSPREGFGDRMLSRATTGKGRRPNQKPNRRKTGRRIRDAYDRESYRRAIARGCKLAEVDTWHPHQLRHTAATIWRKHYGPEGALLMLGDKSTRMVDVYAAKDDETAMRIAREIG